MSLCASATVCSSKLNTRSVKKLLGIYKTPLNAKSVQLSDPVSSVVQNLIYIGITEEGVNCRKGSLAAFSAKSRGNCLKQTSLQEKTFVEVHPSTVKSLSWLEDGFLFSSR